MIACLCFFNEQKAKRKTVFLSPDAIIAYWYKPLFPFLFNLFTILFVVAAEIYKIIQLLFATAKRTHTTTPCRRIRVVHFLPFSLGIRYLRAFLSLLDTDNTCRRHQACIRSNIVSRRPRRKPSCQLPPLHLCVGQFFHTEVTFMDEFISM